MPFFGSRQIGPRAIFVANWAPADWAPANWAPADWALANQAPADWAPWRQIGLWKIYSWQIVFHIFVFDIHCQ